jgi:hypothetical protein
VQSVFVLVAMLVMCVVACRANVTLPPGSGPIGVTVLSSAGLLVVSMGAASYLYVLSAAL